MTPDYEDVPYRGHPVEYASPASLALAARRAGVAPVSLEQARVLDIGCGDGAHLLPLAFHHPDWELVGIDTSERAVEAARRAAATLELRNVRFEVADVRGFEPSSPFDVVTAHGIYSWVDAETRAALRARMRAALSTRGLGYVCFNALPGWGVRGRVRDRLRGLDVPAARARARSLAQMVAGSEDPWSQLLVRELSRIEQASDGYLAHEYLTEHNVAFWLDDIVAAFRADGLRYVADAMALHPEGQVAPALRDAVGALADADSERAQLVDLLAYRQMRGAVFVRDDAPMEAKEGWFEQAYFFGVLRALSDPFDLQPGVEEPFLAGGTEVRVASGLSKMALLTMSHRFPDAFTLDELVSLAADGLAGRGYRPDLESESKLRDGLGQLLDHHMIRARTGCPRIVVEPAETPVATRLARFEAERGFPTTPMHSSLPLDPLDRALLTALDGRSKDAVAEHVAAEITAGRLHFEGVPDNRFRVEAFVRERLDPLVQTAARWGLLEAP